MIGKTSYDIFPLEEADRIAAREDQLLQSDRPIIDERQIRTPCNGIRTIVSRRLVVRDNRKPLYVIGVMEDITERKRAEDEIRRTKKFLDTVIEHVPAPIAVKDVPSSAKDARDCRFTLLNRAGEELLGVPRQQIIGKTAAELYPKESADHVIADDSKALRSEQMMLTCDYPLITPGNGTRLVTARKIAIRDDDGKPQYLLAVLDDVTERRKSEQRIVHMAHYDTLTDLPNRATFNETMVATLDRAATTGEQFAVLSIDLDRFKEANDTYGHLVGDALLREVANRLQAATREAFLARIGGDEFALIVADGPQPESASALSDRLLAACVEDFEVEGQRLKLGMSIGAAVYPTDGTDAKTLMVNADAALYRAKAEFRGMALFFEPEMGARLRERHALQEDLRSAIDRGELLLHYQPQVKMSGETIGFEALARWQCPKRGMVPPGTFIPIAEESSLIIPVGEWILREACREAASWPQPLTISVNISPIQFRHGDLPRLVHSVLLETGLAPNRLELEITEGVLIGDFSRAVSILRRLKSLGVKIAMDDFGTGYSSLSYLHAFPFDKIKIDRTFISDLKTNRHSIAIVRALIGLSRSLKIPILAEGVETQAQHAFLAQEGCAEVQGYLTGRPLEIANYAGVVGRKEIATTYSHAV
jgi:diguanylate cyclase (GGDEF)-like protein/PAS domain S-box-containing protein